VCWHGRLELEAATLTLAESQLALSALASLCAGDTASVDVLRRLLRKVRPTLLRSNGLKHSSSQPSRAIRTRGADTRRAGENLSAWRCVAKRPIRTGLAFRPWRSRGFGSRSARGLGRRRTNERTRSRCHMPPADRLALGGGSACGSRASIRIRRDVTGPGTPAAQARRPLRRRSRGEDWPQMPLDSVLSDASEVLPRLCCVGYSN
jgi:hypothetical protein